MKSKIYNIILITVILLILIIDVGKAAHWDVDGWTWIENKDKIVLWQKSEKEFISENLLNIAVPIGCEILWGYTVKFNNNIIISDYRYNTYAVGFWKIIYNGLDSSGNIYLKIIREKDGIANSDILKIKEEIMRVSSFTGTEENLIEMRLELFRSILENYLEKEGETIVIDSTKTIVINGLDNIPPFKIEINDKHLMVNASVVSLE